MRADNWNEKLGRVSASEVALVSSLDGIAAPAPIRDFLKSLGQRGKYAGLSGSTDLSDETLDSECSIRFQTTFLPVLGDRGTIEFATEAYSYNTLSDRDPRNLVCFVYHARCRNPAGWRRRYEAVSSCCAPAHWHDTSLLA